MTTLQRSLDDTARRLSVHAPIVAMPGLHKLTLALGFWLDHRYNLGTSLHQFKIVQHTSAARKMLKDRANQHKVVAGSGAAPFLSGAATLTAKDRVSLLATLSMAWGGPRAAEGVPVHLVHTVPLHHADQEGCEHRNHGEVYPAR